jgi:hypothetical protein
MSAPQLTINPLSAIAPGFLRNLFGALDPGGPFPGLPPVETQPSQPLGR